MVNHDSLTGLPNRSMFQQVLGDVIKRAQRYPEDGFAVMFIDLDRFKSVNDTYGHHTGDTLLKLVADRLRGALRESDLVARLGGDEFVVLLNRITEQEDARVVANNILALFSETLYIDEQGCDISASIGISLFGVDADTESALMKHADAAMYVAKDEGRNNAQFYAEDIHQRISEKVSLERHLRGALDRDELEIHYQAVLDTVDDSIIGVEALLRWNSPALGEVSPERFIPVAEETGMILGIGDWVIRNAARQVVQWQQAGIGPLKLAVNLSARQFNDKALAERVQEVLQETGLHPSQLELEITESTMMHNPRRTTALMSSMRELGVRFALDDFGTGYSSMNQLKSYPLETLKVDRTFVSGLEGSASDQAICRAIISLGQTLGMQIVAEGVETAEQQAFLRQHKCEFVQGFLFHRPQAANDFEQFYRSR